MCRELQVSLKVSNDMAFHSSNDLTWSLFKADEEAADSGLSAFFFARIDKYSERK